MARAVHATLLTAALTLLLGACSDLPSAPELQPSFSAGGNAAAAQQCQKGNFAKVYRADGTPFTSPGDCISYAAQGGELVTRRITTVGPVYFTACNDLTAGYEINGVHTDLRSNPVGCWHSWTPAQYQIEHFSNQDVRLFLRDNTCSGWVFYEDGNRADVTADGSGSLRVRIMDAGGFCEFPPAESRVVGGPAGFEEFGNMTTWRRTEDG
jgi:hypothetical protein